MEIRFGVFADAVLAKKGLIVDIESRNAVIEEVAKAATQAAKKLQRNASSDFRPA